jgi:hypothetical protein
VRALLLEEPVLEGSTTLAAKAVGIYRLLVPAARPPGRRSGSRAEQEDSSEEGDSESDDARVSAALV